MSAGINKISVIIVVLNRYVLVFLVLEPKPSEFCAYNYLIKQRTSNKFGTCLVHLLLLR